MQPAFVDVDIISFMVIFDLQCENHHQFEGWFKNSEDLESQKAKALLRCPVCETLAVEKKISGSKITKKSNNSSSSSTAVANANTDVQSYKQLQTALRKVHRHIDENFKDVGNQFADEALKIHRGEKDAENIRGIASKSELKELAEEGVSALPLPPKPVEKDKLN